MCGRICVCAGVRKCAEIRKPAQFLHLRAFFLCGLRADIVRKTLSRLHVGARNAISCAQGAENAFPAFSERMTPSGTLYSRLVPDGPFCQRRDEGDENASYAIRACA